MGRTIIISNRLPLRVQKNKEGELEYIPSEGGLATGLGSVYKGSGNIWIGWPGIYFKSTEEKEEARKKLEEENMLPVYLSKKEIEEFYEGFCNSTLWPNFHYFNQFAIYRRTLWKAYVEVNKRFCEAVLEVARPDDTIWIHDYQLLLLPGLLREKLPKISIGFFLHIPFPSHEVFRLIPWRKELLNGVLGSDLIGFHTYDDMRHFLSAVNRLVYYSNEQGKIQVGNRVVFADSFPMGIDFDKYANAAMAPETIAREVKFRTSVGDQKLILSIDRLDYSKGIPARLIVFELFLKKFPEYREKVSLILLVVPSRDQVVQYRELKEEVDLLVGRINGAYGTMNWTPIHYFYRSLPMDMLSALYRMSEVALVTPMRDGMNLVCKEYVASKLDQKGVLILSEMAGASKELNQAILINPNDKHQVADALKQALEQPEEEQKKNMAAMQETLKRYNVHHWVNLFLTSLQEVKDYQHMRDTRVIDNDLQKEISSVYKASSKRLLFLDYDGTLVPFNTDPEKAVPDKSLLEVIQKLSSDKKNRVVVISGRDQNTLKHWLGDLPIDIIAEHGVWYKERKSEWKIAQKLDVDWKADIRDILEMYVSKTPGSFIEEKDYSLAWHYRKVETGLGELRAREIISHLKFLVNNMDLQVLEGSMVVEIKNKGVNKGKAATTWLQKYPSAFMLAIGDDWTDEDTFKAMPKEAFTIKVGQSASTARYNLPDFKKVREFLEALGK